MMEETRNIAFEIEQLVNGIMDEKQIDTIERKRLPIYMEVRFLMGSLSNEELDKYWKLIVDIDHTKRHQGCTKLAELVLFIAEKIIKSESESD